MEVVGLSEVRKSDFLLFRKWSLQRSVGIVHGRLSTGVCFEGDDVS